VLEVPLDEHDAAVEVVRRVMESVWPLDVPLKVEIATGMTWADAKD
jgi:DNA polymerase I-like protein with 3'-5' exonuclease and polymerase domains